MNPRYVVPMIAVMGLLGWLGAWLFSPSAGWTVLGLVAGLVFGWLMARAGVRATVGPAIVGGGIVGAWIGREIVRALCLPGSCVNVEVAGSVITGLGSTLGIGLVVALVVRSFDEYWENRQNQQPPAG